MVPSDRMRGDWHKLKHKKLHMNMRGHFVSVRVTEPWHGLPREVVASPSLEILRTHLDALVNCLQRAERFSKYQKPSKTSRLM